MDAASTIKVSRHFGVCCAIQSSTMSVSAAARFVIFMVFVWGGWADGRLESRGMASKGS